MSKRKILFRIHLAAGCTSGIVILIMAVSGTLLMYRRQVTAWCDSGFRSTRTSNTAARLPMEVALAKVCARRSASPTAVTLRADPNAPIEASYGVEHLF